MSDHYQSSGNSSHIGYVPEVRTSYHEPIFVGGQIVDSEWRQIKVEREYGLVGIPDGYFDAKLRENDLWGFTQAQAIRWWFMARADGERAMGSMCLETRLVKVKLLETYEKKSIGFSDSVDWRGKPIEIPEEAKP